MNNCGLLSLYFVDTNGQEHYGLALAPGKYQASSDSQDQDAYLIIFMCWNCDSIFNLYYVSSSGKYLGHTPLHSGEDSIDYVLLEAWREFDVLPHYWILAEENKHPWRIKKELNTECTKSYQRLREVVSRFRWAEISKLMVDIGSGVSSKAELTKGEQDRRFYPDIPQEILTPLTL
jgi:hypothetical protein